MFCATWLLCWSNYLAVWNRLWLRKFLSIGDGIFVIRITESHSPLCRSWHWRNCAHRTALRFSWHRIHVMPAQSAMTALPGHCLDQLVKLNVLSGHPPSMHGMTRDNHWKSWNRFDKTVAEEYTNGCHVIKCWTPKIQKLVKTRILPVSSVQKGCKIVCVVQKKIFNERHCLRDETVN